MEIPANAVELVKKWEGLHRKGSDGLIYPYLCPAGVWTIGFGSTRELDGTPITKTTFPKTVEQCEDLMLWELGKCVRSVLKYSPSLATNEEALGALSSFVFNLGAGNYYRSTLRRRINQGDFDEARKELRKWVWAGGRRLPGLVSRRNEEASYLNA